MASAAVIRLTAAPTARGPAQPLVVAVDMLMATLAYPAPQRADRETAIDASQVRRASDAWPDLLAALTDPWMEWGDDATA